MSEAKERPLRRLTPAGIRAVVAGRAHEKPIAGTAMKRKYGKRVSDNVAGAFSYASFTPPFMHGDPFDSWNVVTSSAATWHAPALELDDQDESAALSVHALMPDRPSFIPAKPKLEVGFEAIRDAIEESFKRDERDSATRDLCRIGAKVDELRTLCTARLRLKLPDERNPAIDDITAAESSDLPIGCAANALRVARQLVSEVRRKLDRLGGTTVEFEAASLGCVRVDWEGYDMLWVVSPSELPWPGVSVRVYPPSDAPARTYLTAHDVISATVDALSV